MEGMHHRGGMGGCQDGGALGETLWVCAQLRISFTSVQELLANHVHHRLVLVCAQHAW